MWLLALQLACSGSDKDVRTAPGGETDAPSSDDSDRPTETAPPDTGPIDIDWPEQRVGIFYLTWHTFGAYAQNQRPAAERLTVEDVIQDSSLTFADIISDAGLYNEAAGFHWHQEPELGFYCLYRHRDGEADQGYDCEGISETAARHAELLWEAGVDFVYVDVTNFATTSDSADKMGLRPFEVLLEEWSALRQAGVPTPQIAAWAPAQAGSDSMWDALLAVYADYADQDLLLTIDGQPAIFAVDHTTDEAALESARGQGVTPVRMWGNLSDSELDGVLGWMQPCTTDGSFTTWVRPTSDCDQGTTADSPIGSQVSASLSYQIGYASLPWQSSGRMDGLTFKKQMETALRERPDILMINAWNEHIAQPQANPYADYGTLAHSMGVGSADTSDWLWVDMYGVAFNRDFEPTVEDGDAAYQLLRSCLDVYRSGATSCDDSSEACCDLGLGMNMVHSLRQGSTATSGDHVLTLSESEKSTLQGSGYQEVCSPFYAPPGLCSGGADGDGPFMLYAESGSDRKALYRCYTGVGHFFSTDSACEGTTVEGPLGWVSTLRTSATPRPMRRCYNADEQHHLHWLDESCPSGVSQEAILGYVR